MTVEDEVLEDLKIELQISDKNFSETLITQKVKNAVREVKRVRNYPDSYTEDMIEKDMEKFFSNIREIALYDYNSIGRDFESSHSEDSVTQTMVDRGSLFLGVLPFAKI